MTSPEPLVQPYHFIVSSPRSGSTWLARALNHHPDILATENRLFGLFCEIWKNGSGNSRPRITVDQFIDGFTRHSFFKEIGFESAAGMATELQHEFIAFLAGFLRNRSGKQVVVDKVTPYLGTADKVLGFAKAHFRDARFVHLIRDGRDVAVSGVFDWINRENPGSARHKLFVENDSSIKLKRFFDDELLSRWTQYWTEPIHAFAGGTENTIEVRFESMLEHQAASLDRIFRFLGVAEEPEIGKACAEAATFEKTTGRPAGEEQPLSKARKGIAGDWKNYFTRQDALRFQELTGDLLQTLGYENDTGWVEQCPESLDLHRGEP